VIHHTGAGLGGGLPIGGHSAGGDAIVQTSAARVARRKRSKF
jgi:hypothetical protein